jgi:pyruvate,water dikinase
MTNYKYIKVFAELGIGDIALVGGKNASLGEMFSALTAHGIRVPDGFAVTAEGYRNYLRHNALEQRITDALARLDVEDLQALAQTGAQIRAWISGGSFPDDIADEISSAYRALENEYGSHLDVAVRSSATAEDLPNASFAGQQETYLNIHGIENLLQVCKRVLASLFTDRAISYRVHQGFDHMSVALSIGVQKMVRADIGASGVLFTLDTESGFRDVVLVTASWGLGENVVGGAVNPDEFLVFKPTLANGHAPILRRRLGEKKIKMVYARDSVTGPSTRNVAVHPREQQRFCVTDNEVLQLARMAVAIEQHYSERHGRPQPMDIEWARDGDDGKLYIVQARPETVHATQTGLHQVTYELKTRGTVITRGRSVGKQIASGTARIILDSTHMNELQPGEILVTDITDPDWEPIMKKAAAIITNRGGRVCHAAIIARELGIPAVVGTNNATKIIPDGSKITVSCASGEEGIILEGELPFTVEQHDIGELATPKTEILLNIGNPGTALARAALPCAGVGLARLEFIIADTIGIHPRALLEYDRLDAELQQQITARTHGYASPVDFYVNRLSEGIATIAAAFYPRPVNVRLSDFKSNEYATLLGGERYEPHEENPMLGLRGASRYYSEGFRECFALECRAVHKVRHEMGLDNVRLIIPFVRSVQELCRVLDLMAGYGLERDKHGLQVYIMCELPANVLLAADFLEHCDGFSIGSNDLTQLTLGVDRDSSLLEDLDERNPAAMEMISLAIKAGKHSGKPVSICGQAPSDFPDLVGWLVRQDIDAISVNHDSLISVLQLVLQAEAQKDQPG